MRLLSGILPLALVVASFGQTGPTLVGAGYVDPISPRVAPGQILTFYLTGIQPVLSKQQAMSLPLPFALAGFTATIHQQGTYTPGNDFPFPVPLVSVVPIGVCAAGAPISSDCMVTAVTVQIPFEIGAHNPLSFGAATPPDVSTTEMVFANAGHASQSFALYAVFDAIHLLTNCDAGRAGNYGGLPCSALVTHADGTLVSPPSAAKPGEIVVMYGYGLGRTSMSATTGAPSPQSADNASTGFRLRFDYRVNGPKSSPDGTGVHPVFAGLTPGSIGLYQINFVVPQPPPGTPPCGGAAFTNLTVNVDGFQSSDGVGICVDTN